MIDVLPIEYGPGESQRVNSVPDWRAFPGIRHVAVQSIVLTVEMEAQNICCARKRKIRLFVGKQIRFVTFLDLNKSLEQIKYQKLLLFAHLLLGYHHISVP